MTPDFSIQKIYQRLLSNSIQFQENAGDFLDRLDHIGVLIQLRESEPALGEDIHKLIISGLEKIKDLSAHLRELIHKNSYDGDELNLLRTVLENQDKMHLINEYRYVVGYEWLIRPYNVEKKIIETHRGDLILMNEAYNFLVIELKFFKNTGEFWRNVARKNRRLKHVFQQAKKFEDFFAQQFPWTYTQSLAITNLGMYNPRTKKLLQRIEYED
ncbi:hypothetical protein ACKFKG_17285 [Phormidesmis sp. 146-35]